MDYAGKTVVITGASSGIGKESARSFAKLHADIVLVSRNRDRLEEAASELSGCKGRVLVCPCDVSKRGEVDGMAGEVLEKLGRIDVLVNNAGFGIYGKFSDGDQLPRDGLLHQGIPAKNAGARVGTHS